MDHKRYVLDANVFLEYIFGRRLATQSKTIIQYAIKQKIEIMIPSLALDEIAEVLCGNLNDIEQVKHHLAYLEKLILTDRLKIIVPTAKVRVHAIHMARQSHEKSGYPEFTDCLYHALAIFNQAIFITNDKKHIRKLKSFGHFQLLEEWQAG